MCTVPFHTMHQIMISRCPSKTPSLAIFDIVKSISENIRGWAYMITFSIGFFVHQNVPLTNQRTYFLNYDHYVIRKTKKLINCVFVTWTSFRKNTLQSMLFSMYVITESTRASKFCSWKHNRLFNWLVWNLSEYYKLIHTVEFNE